jgi:hypothetical protein
MSTVVDSHKALDPWTVDGLLERYVYWREECIAVRETYRRWAGSECSERRLSRGAYFAALDREELAPTPTRSSACA